MLHVVGGAYREVCMHPNWCEVYGSAGRAVSAIASVGGKATLHARLDPLGQRVIAERAAIEGFEVRTYETEGCSSFRYIHGLATPEITLPKDQAPALQVSEEHIVRFGMIDSDAVVHAEAAVYDPQSARDPRHFNENGSTAKRLAIILNAHEASLLTNRECSNPHDTASELSRTSGADVVIIKMGAKGALVMENGVFTNVPAFRTGRVWKLGSGDTFVAHFAFNWLSEGLPAAQSASNASRATAYYCEFRGFPSKHRLGQYKPSVLKPSLRYTDGYRPRIYLAGPFFTLAELWLIEQARANLREMGLEVFSPFHDIGRGSAEDVVELDLQAIHKCDLVFAITDGLDAGTVYEIGYARALRKPVIVYSENESDEDKKMMQGSQCHICNDYVTAIYTALWTAAEL